ncbi:MAG: peptide chain release factor N(5)-glutamine methyltransferase [Candidatus Eisenbacteria bacterium]
MGEALRAATQRLVAAGHAASDAEELLSRLLGTGRGELRTRGPQPFPMPQVAAFEAWLARRERGEPVQYITGRAAFRELDLAVDTRVLIPRPETELLVEAVLEHLATQDWTKREPRVLDLGTGSGCIALSIAHEQPRARVTATDASVGALALARANAAALGLDARVTFAHGAWFHAVDPDERYDVIVSNPPYIAPSEAAELPADVRDWEPHSALFAADDGLADVRDILDEAPRHLLTGGLLALELSETRATTVSGWLEGAHDWAGVELRDDLAGRPRVLLARRERGPAIAPAQWGEER